MKKKVMHDVFVPVVKWTPYGRWTHDGLYVLGARGEVIYTHPEVERQKHVARVSFANMEIPTL